MLNLIIAGAIFYAILMLFKYDSKKYIWASLGAAASFLLIPVIFAQGRLSYKGTMDTVSKTTEQDEVSD